MLQNATALTTKCVGWIYYKMLYMLLHNAHIITKCESYYKMRRYYKMPQNNVLSYDLFVLIAFQEVCRIPR